MKPYTARKFSNQIRITFSRRDHFLNEHIIDIRLQLKTKVINGCSEQVITRCPRRVMTAIIFFTLTSVHTIHLNLLFLGCLQYSSYHLSPVAHSWSDPVRDTSVQLNLI